MDKRYQHPQVAALWGLPWTYDAWWRIEQAITRAQLEVGIVASTDALPLIRDRLQPNFTDQRMVLEIENLEKTTKHDVAAFLAWVRSWWGEPHARWVHYGVTSSDLVDTAQGMRFKAMGGTLMAEIGNLLTSLKRWEDDQTPILGRTHGQPAEPTAIGIRALHWTANIGPAAMRLAGDTQMMCTAKIAGPVGTYAHNPPSIEAAVAKELHLAQSGIGSSQITPRGDLARWANSAAGMVNACAKVAMDLRLMDLLGEAREEKTGGQVGSSAMPHKTNPVRAEQITGLARLAAGYASALQPLDLWLERDISHSSVERVAVPDLWHVVLHVMAQTATLLTETKVDEWRVQDNLEQDANAAYSHHTTLLGIQDGMPYDEARAFGLGTQIESYDLKSDVKKDFLSNFPWRTDERA